jgi:Zn-dependent protease with chaperone function
MTATRIVRGATIAVAVVLWVLFALLLWRTKVPHELRLPHLDEDAVFGPGLVRRARSYERLLDLLWVGATLTDVVVLAVLVRRGRRLAAGLGLGRVNAGIVVGVVALAVVWAAGLPWIVVSQWWERRHGVSYESYAATLSGAWAQLLGQTFVAFVALAVLLGLASALRRRWWIAAVPVVLGIATGLQFVVPYLATVGTHPLRDRALAAQLRRLEDREHAGRPALRVDTVSNRTREANAFSIGFGPSARVIFWDTLLQEFSPREVRFVAAHELAHIARKHILKGLAWFGLLTLPVLALVAFVTDRRGGLLEPANIPLGLLVLVLALLALLPLRNAISRRYEAEADWIGLAGSRDPGAARELFRGFSRESLQDPSPPGWVHVFLDDHPTDLQRIEQARAWARRYG